MTTLTLDLPVASRERVMLRTLQAQAQLDKMPRRIVLNSREYAKLAKEMRRYGFVSTRFRQTPLQVLNVPIECNDVEETAPDDKTVRFEWSD